MDVNAEIITNYVHPPIPVRCFDWEAYRKGYDAGDPVGRGETRLDAIADLIRQEVELGYEPREHPAYAAHSREGRASP
jgi:hypothetical protein